MSALTPLPGEAEIREQIRRVLAAADNYPYEELEPHDYADQASVIADMIRPLIVELGSTRARVAELENALAATGRSLSSFIFDSEDPGADAFAAQWLYRQARPEAADDPFDQPTRFRTEILREAVAKQRKFIDSDEYVSEDWEAAHTVVDLIDPDEAAKAGDPS